MTVITTFTTSATIYYHHADHLTRVPAPVVVAGAHEDVRDDLVAAGAEEHLLAALVAHDWHRYLRREINI